MKNEEVKEIFDEVDVDLMLIQDRLAAAIEWVETGRVCGSRIVETDGSIKTPLDYLKFVRDRIGITREFFKDWRASKKLGGEK